MENGGIRMIEFFSGIGGFRLGVEAAIDELVCDSGIGESVLPQKRRADGTFAESGASSLHLASCHAYEISLFANGVYERNFKDNKEDDAQSENAEKGKRSKHKNKKFGVHTKLVEQLKVEQLDGKADLWTMSPPCQPFTRTRLARQRDTADKRTAGFLALTKLLVSLKSPPKWIVLENVKGFVGSDAHRQWCEQLKARGYSWQGFLLSPMQFGIPNNRMRYYQIIELSNRWSNDDILASPLTKLETRRNESPARPLSNYVTKLPKEQLGDFLLSRETLSKNWAKDLSVISRRDAITFCFTAAYGRILHKSSGSLLHIHADHAFEDAPLDRSDMTAHCGSIRRFTPRELLSLFGFPPSFSFSPGVSLEKQYKLVGNSVNVNVISYVVGELLSKVPSRQIF